MGKNTHLLGRRQFLKWASFALGGAALPGALLDHWHRTPSPARTQAPSCTLKVGLLLPRSELYPTLAQDVTAGMAAGLGMGAARLIPAAIDAGERPALRAARRLLEQDGIDLLVGLLGPAVAARVGQVCAACGVPLVACGVGANIVRDVERHPLVFHHSLGQWQANWALGRWAAQELGSRAAMLSGFYDSGYDASYAFYLGFEAGGGEVLQSATTHVPGTTEDFGARLEGVRALAPDVVYAAYAGPEAVDFVRAYAATPLHGKVPLVGGAFLVDERWLPHMGRDARGIWSALGWAHALDTAESRALSTAYRALTGRAPGALAALGYDTARLIAAAGTPAGLAGAACAGTGGAVQIDPQTRESRVPLYLRQVRRAGWRWANQRVAALPPVPAADPALAAARTSLKTGWLNAYLSV